MTPEGRLRSKLSAGKALTTISAARPERIAKKDKRIVIELGSWKLARVPGQLRQLSGLYTLRKLVRRGVPDRLCLSRSQSSVTCVFPCGFSPIQPLRPQDKPTPVDIVLPPCPTGSLRASDVLHTRRQQRPLGQRRAPQAPIAIVSTVRPPSFHRTVSLETSASQ